jgi:thiamine-phosphate pyrophosphorylase
VRTDGRAPLIYLITDRHAAGDDQSLAAVVARALGALTGSNFPRPAVAVQLREKDLPGRALCERGRELRAVTAAAGVRLFVNDRIDIALAVGADGVHLGGGALTVDDTHVLAPGLQIALSTHTAGEVARAAADPRVSFVVFGPVFDTPSKRSFGPAQGLEALRRACSAPIPVLALGGVDADQIPACFGAGASGVASMRGVLRNPHPEAALRRFFGAIEST